MGKGKPQDPGLTQLCKSAFHAEYRRDFAQALTLHTAALQGLNKVLSDAGFFDTQTKHIARKQIKFHSNRLNPIRPLAQGQPDAPLPIILPTSVGAEDDLKVLRNGRACLSLVSSCLSIPSCS